MNQNASTATASAYPSDVTFHDLIRQNRRNSMLLIFAMVLLVIAVSFAMMLVMTGGQIDLRASIITGVVAGLLTFALGSWSYYGGSKTVLSISGARQIQKSDDPQLFNIVEEMAIAAGLPVPAVYVMDTPALNAFATGRDPQHAAVAVTTGLREKLNRDELTGVIAHEIAHIRHYDIRLTMLVATLVGVIVMFSDVVIRMMFYGRMGRSSGGGRGGKGGGGAAAILMILALVFVILSPILATLIQFAVSRQREYLADAGAVELTRYPAGLASALRKLTSDHTPMEKANRATAHMFIVNPIMNARHQENRNTAFSTHPPINQRIERLGALLR